jgi:hypothetical protein
MKNKIVLATLFAMAGIVFLAGCISINVNETPESVAPAAKGGSTTNNPSVTTTNMIQ